MAFSRTGLSVAVATLAFASGVPSAAQDGKSRFQPRHVAKMEFVTSAVMSPSGEQVAYNVSVPRKPLGNKDGPAWSELYVADSQGASRPFITGEVNIGGPQWSADGASIYYTARRAGDEQAALYRIPVDGGESVCVFRHDTAIRDFDLSPDGTQLALLAKPKTDEEIEKLHDRGFDQEIVEEDPKSTQVWIVSIDPDATEPDPDAEPRMLELPGSAYDVQWSPRGRELVVVLAPTPLVDDYYMHRQVHVVDSESGRIVYSVDNPGKLGDVAWSPDGEHLAMVSGVDEHDPREGRLMVSTIDGEGGLTDLLPDLKAHVSSIAWRDESTLVWLAADGVSSRIGTVTLDGRRNDLIEPGGETVYLSLSSPPGAKAVALLGESPTHGSELFVAPDLAAEPERWTKVNPWLDEMRFAEQSVVRYKARDGLELQGILVRPLHYVEGRRYPTIMYVHGGPEARIRNGWVTSYSEPGQVAAARGFMVFYPNYRGSIGAAGDVSRRRSRQSRRSRPVRLQPADASLDGTFSATRRR